MRRGAVETRDEHEAWLGPRRSASAAHLESARSATAAHIPLLDRRSWPTLSVRHCPKELDLLYVGRAHAGFKSVPFLNFFFARVQAQPCAYRMPLGTPPCETETTHWTQQDTELARMVQSSTDGGHEAIWTRLQQEGMAWVSPCQGEWNVIHAVDTPIVFRHLTHDGTCLPLTQVTSYGAATIRCRGTRRSYVYIRKYPSLTQGHRVPIPSVAHAAAPACAGAGRDALRALQSYCLARGATAPSGRSAHGPRGRQRHTRMGRPRICASASITAH